MCEIHHQAVVFLLATKCQSLVAHSSIAGCIVIKKVTEFTFKVTLGATDIPKFAFKFRALNFSDWE